MADFYDVLGISHQAENDVIAKAYRRFALAYNPDCNPHHANPQQLTHKFKLVAQAYTVLSDPKTRAIYDQYGEDGVRHGGTGTSGVPGGLDIDHIDPNLVFRRYFGVDSPFQVIGGSGDTVFNGPHSMQHLFFSESAAINKRPPKTAPVRTTLNVSLEDVALGSVRSVSWNRCHISQNREEGPATAVDFSFAVPQGVEDGDVVTLCSKGNTHDGHSQGDVLVMFKVDPHANFQRDKDNLIITVPVTLTEALCGTTLSIRTLDGRSIPILVDEVIGPQFQKVLMNEGLPTKTPAGSDPKEIAEATHINQKNKKRGNLIVRCATQFPNYLSPEQKLEIARILAIKPSEKK